MENAYNTIVFSSNFGSADFWPKIDPIRPNQNVPNYFPMYYVLFINYLIANSGSWKVVIGAEIA